MARTPKLARCIATGENCSGIRMLLRTAGMTEVAMTAMACCRSVIASVSLTGMAVDVWLVAMPHSVQKVDWTNDTS